MAPSPQNMLHKMIRAVTILYSLFCAMLLHSIRVVAALMIVCGTGYALDIPGTHLSAYTVSGVRVDAAAETVAAAREAALSQGRQHAFRLLATRLGVSAEDIRDKVIPELQKAEADFICLNFANPDMVGHTGVFEAAVKACETTLPNRQSQAT